MISWFQSLSIGGKIAFVAGYILMILFLILWEIYNTQRHDAKRLPMVMPTSTIEETKKLVHTITTPTSKQNQYNAHRRARHLLEIFRINLKKSIVYCKSRDDGNNPAHHLQQYIQKVIISLVRWITPAFSISHIRTIVNKLMTKSSDLVNKLVLFAIGLGVGIFVTLARTQPTLPIELRVSLVAISVATLFVGFFSLRFNPSKNYQPNSKKDYATDENLCIVVPNYPNKCTGYHQTYANPFHIFLSLLRHIISYCKLKCQPKWKRTVFKNSALPVRGGRDYLRRFEEGPMGILGT